MRRLPTLLILALSVGSTSGADVEWRQDYAAARAEATRTGRPLLLVFESEACTFCRKLDGTTFRDAKVVRAANGGFVPVKIDGRAEKKLAEALKVGGYPTIVVATAAGKIVGRSDGYADAGEMMALFEKASPAEPAPVEKAKPTAGPDESRGDRQKLQGRIEADLDSLYDKIANDLNRSANRR